MIISLICSGVICFMVIYGVKPVLPVFAETNTPVNESENVTPTLTGLLPDIQKIYRESLTMPFIQAESEIYDEDIADFYHNLMEKTA